MEERDADSAIIADDEARRLHTSALAPVAEEERNDEIGGAETTLLADAEDDDDSEEEEKESESGTAKELRRAGEPRLLC